MQRLQKWNLSWGRPKNFLLILFLLSASAIALHVFSVSAGSSSFMQFVSDRTEHAVLYLMPMLTINKDDNSPDDVRLSAVLAYTITFSNVGDADAAGVIITDTFDNNVTFERSRPISPTDGTGNVRYWQINEPKVRDLGNIATAVTVSTSIPISYSLSILEGFEACVIPPSGWTHIQTNPNETWRISVLDPHSGCHCATVYYDRANQDELLLSPTFTADTGSVSLWSCGSLYWCRDTYDKCDLEVWFVNGSWDRGGGDDVFLGIVDNDWTGTWAWSHSTFDFSPHASGNPARIALRYIGNYGDDVAVDDITITYFPPLFFTKSSDPPGEVHEGDVITYTISYANTGSIVQTGVVITDRIPSNTELVPGSISPDYGTVENRVISWYTDTLDIGETRVVSFQVRIPLLPSFSQSVDMLSSMEAYPPAQVLPVPIACGTTRFWANGVTRQPSVPDPHTIQVQVPPGTSPPEMWLLMKGTDNISPTVGGHPAQLVMTSTNSFGASLWSASFTPTMVAGNQVVTVTTYDESKLNRLNALFLFNEDDPPFDEAVLYDFSSNKTETFTYTLEIPSVATQTIDVILPFMDITDLTDNYPPEPDTRRTKVTLEFNSQSDTLTVNVPNLGNGLVMTQFPFTIGPLSDTITSTKVLTVTVDTEDSVYTLGPRVCQPVYIKNTAWLCSDQVGCISATATNIPEDFVRPSAGDIYLPIIQKSSP